jgi:hypothetical protein
MVAPVPTQISKPRRRKFSCPSRRSTPNSRPVNPLQPLSSLVATPVLCFQQLAASFPKTPGCGVLRFLPRPPIIHYPLLATHSPLTTFRMNTCKSVSKQSTLTIFRMNTYEKRGGGGYRDSAFDYPPLAARYSLSVARQHAPRSASISCAPQSIAQANPDSPQNSRSGYFRSSRLSTFRPTA